MTMLNESIRWETQSRYYYAVLSRDLFGEIVVSRCWGGKGNRLGGMATDYHESEAEAWEALRKLALVRARHGYQRLN